MEFLFAITVISLIAFNGFLVWTFQKQVNVLVDKASSRSYAEYVQTKNLEQVKHFPNVGTQELPHIEDDAVLQELNSIIS